MDLPWKPDGFPDGWIDLRWLVNSATANDRRGDNRAFLSVPGQKIESISICSCNQVDDRAVRQCLAASNPHARVRRKSARSR